MLTRPATAVHLFSGGGAGWRTDATRSSVVVHPMDIPQLDVQVAQPFQAGVEGTLVRHPTDEARLTWFGVDDLEAVEHGRQQVGPVARDDDLVAHRLRHAGLPTAVSGTARPLPSPTMGDCVAFTHHG